LPKATFVSSVPSVIPKGPLAAATFVLLAANGSLASFSSYGDKRVKLLGPIIRLQVQLASLKVGEKPFQQYDPAPIAIADGLILTDGGVHGVDAAGERLADVHHRDHPHSKYREENAISIGFTGHYQLMRARFGAKLADGIAAENILVDFAGRVSEEDIAAGLLIETADGRRLTLSDVIVAAPCVPFTRFAMSYPDGEKPNRTVTESLQFLDHGTRGYYARFHGPESPIAPGDLVYLREGP
jgi:hypothetical protein